MHNPVVLETIGISKYFGAVAANKGVDFSLRKGEIHVLMGENGAGKSTLMHIISGLYQADRGQILMGGDPKQIRNPRDALRNGIGMVHQHFMLIPVFTVTENIVLGNEISRGGMMRRDKACEMVQTLSDENGLGVDPNALTGTLPVGIQQRVEILKALYRHASILILDEPTAVLTPRETSDLFQVLRQLTDKGVSIIFITHKLKEALDIADRITVMRQGEVVGTLLPDETDGSQLAAMMVGREIDLKVDKQAAAPGPVRLKVDHITIRNPKKDIVVSDLSFRIRSGEIFGIAGVQGNGQTELASALAGLQPIEVGEIVLDGKTITHENPRERITAGMGHIPEDRIKEGLVLPYTIANNQILSTYYRPPFANQMFRKKKAIIENSARLIDQFDIRAPGPQTIVANLSGGNQQKVIVSRELSRTISFLLANQPTRGLDVGSIDYIHRQIIALRNKGAAVLLISAELDEIMALSDRIGVIYRGKLVRTLAAVDATREQVGLLMTGSEDPR